MLENINSGFHEKLICSISNFQSCYNQLLTSLLPWMRSLTCHLQIMTFNAYSEAFTEFKFYVVLDFNKG